MKTKILLTIPLIWSCMYIIQSSLRYNRGLCHYSIFCQYWSDRHMSALFRYSSFTSLCLHRVHSLGLLLSFLSTRYTYRPLTASQGLDGDSICFRTYGHCSISPFSVVPPPLPPQESVLSTLGHQPLTVQPPPRSLPKNVWQYFPQTSFRRFSISFWQYNPIPFSLKLYQLLSTLSKQSLALFHGIPANSPCIIPCGHMPTSC